MAKTKPRPSTGEDDLEGFLFSDIHPVSAVVDGDALLTSPPLPSTTAPIHDADNVDRVDDDQLFFFDTGATNADSSKDAAVADEKPEKQTPSAPLLSKLTARAAAWSDDDDDDEEGPTVALVGGKSMHKKLRTDHTETSVSIQEYEQRLRKQFERIHGKPKWAEKAAVEAEQNVDTSSTVQPFQSTASLIDGTAKEARQHGAAFSLLSGEKLNILRLRDANWRDYSQSPVAAMDWHANGQVLMTAGLDKTVRLFHIDGKENEKLQSIFIKDMPVRSAAFSPDGHEILVMGRRKFFYAMNVETGRVTKVPGLLGRHEKTFEKFRYCPDGSVISVMGAGGDIVQVSARTKMPVGCLSMNGQVRAIEYSQDGKYLFSVGSNAEVYQWDVRMNACVHKFSDVTSLKPAVLGVCPAGDRFAIGDESGVVNIYDTRQCLSDSCPSVASSVTSLTTQIDNLSINHDGQLMAVSSRVKKDQLRVVHLPSGRVFQNWPTAGTPLGYVQSSSFSPRSQYLAIGNDKGKVLLYQMQHFVSS